MSEIKRCTKCLLPETFETIEFDEYGVCSVCRQAEYKQAKIDWPSRKKMLDEIVERYRGKAEYDCIVPFSGGKDSSFTLLYLIEHYKLKPLVVCFNHGFMRPTITENKMRVLKKLGADYLEYTPSWRIVKKVMREAFLRKTDFCWHCHTGIYAYPLRVAVRHKVPLLFWGEPLAEFSSYYDYRSDEIEYEDEKKFDMYRNLGISADDMWGMINTPEDPVDKRDLLPFTYPRPKELRELGCMSVCLGSFIPWDHVKQTQLIKEQLGWRPDELEGVPNEVNLAAEKIECFMQGPRDYIKYIKRGYSRVTQITSLDIRNGRRTREESEELVRKYEGRKPRTLDIFLEYMGMTEEEFNEVVKKDMVPPYEHDFEGTRNKLMDKVWDFDGFYRENNCKSCKGCR